MPEAPALTPLGDPADGPVDGATVVIEAATAEAALLQLHEQLGPDARIVEVRRVARGGIAGFFAREVVELHAAPPGAAPAVPALVVSGGAAAPTPAQRSASPAERLLAMDEGPSETVDFATYLRQQTPGEPTPAEASEPAAESMVHQALLERATAAARAAVAAATADPAGGVVDPTAGMTGSDQDDRLDAPAGIAIDAEVVRTDGRRAEFVRADGSLAEPTAAREPGPAWSVAALVKVGLPAALVRELDVADPADDIAWTAALAAALRPLCRPLPAGRALLIGPRARGLASGFDVPVTPVGQPIRIRAATVAASVGGGAAGQRWLEDVRGARWLHLVVGGAGWRRLLHHDPLAVSWATGEDAPDAIRLAVELGLVLGGGPVRGRIQRARPLDVALAVRDLLPVQP